MTNDITIRVVPDEKPVPSGVREAELFLTGESVPEHECWENPVPYESDGALGHGFECRICGAFLQAG